MFKDRVYTKWYTSNYQFKGTLVYLGTPVDNHWFRQTEMQNQFEYSTQDWSLVFKEKNIIGAENYVIYKSNYLVSHTKNHRKPEISRKFAGN